MAQEIASAAVGQAGVDLTAAERELIKVDPGSLTFKPPVDEVPLVGEGA